MDLRTHRTHRLRLGQVAIGFQPEGLTDSSRWSERSADHRTAGGRVSTLEGWQNSGTPPGCGKWLLHSGGLRFAPTTGYYLPALQAETGCAGA